MNVNIHIERLILDGLPVTPHQGRLVQAAVETELAHLLADGALSPELAQGIKLASLPIANITLNPKVKPAHLGQQIAHVVYSGIGKK